MLIYFWIVNAPSEVVSYQVTVNSAIRSGSLPQTYDNYLDGIAASGTISITGWDNSWNPISGGSQSYAGLVDKGIYNIDFQTGSITLKEAPVGGVTPATPTWVKFIVALLPWDPLSGPPLPMGFFPPWPLSIGNWLAIPGYPKMLP